MDIFLWIAFNILLVMFLYTDRKLKREKDLSYNVMVENIRLKHELDSLYLLVASADNEVQYRPVNQDEEEWYKSLSDMIKYEALNNNTDYSAMLNQEYYKAIVICKAITQEDIDKFEKELRK